MYSNNPKYKLEKAFGKYRVFTPVNVMEGYSTQRYIEAINQQIYSNSGANRDVLEQVMSIMVEKCNAEKTDKTLRTDIASLANSILYRLKYPVDMHCAVRMGAILSFIEEDTEHGVIAEPEDKIETVWLNKKTEIAFLDDELYTFFLSWGIVNTPKYNEASSTLNDTEYFRKRMEAIRAMLPEHLTKLFKTL